MHQPLVGRAHERRHGQEHRVRVRLAPFTAPCQEDFSKPLSPSRACRDGRRHLKGGSRGRNRGLLIAPGHKCFQPSRQRLPLLCGELIDLGYPIARQRAVVKPVHGAAFDAGPLIEWFFQKPFRRQTVRCVVEVFGTSQTTVLIRHDAPSAQRSVHSLAKELAVLIVACLAATRKSFKVQRRVMIRCQRG